MGNISNIQKRISFYSKTLFRKGEPIIADKDIPFDLFIDGIRTGEWQDYVLPVRAIPEKKQRDALKVKAPSVTIAGTFNEGRTDNSLRDPSGFICMDVDEAGLPENTTPAQLRDILSNDRYCVASFISISGRGNCAVFAIEPSKHILAFRGLCEYLFETYNITCDVSSVNVSRCRFVSYDPEVYFTANYIKFTKYPKEVEPKKLQKVVFIDDDFHAILKQIVDNKINITNDSYFRWMKIGFAFVTQFGEAGRTYFHLISQFSSKYELKPGYTDKQYDAYLRHTASSREATIATFYYYCKDSGVELYSAQTRKIIQAASHAKKSGLNADQVVENLKNFEDIEADRETVQNIINQKISDEDDTLIDQLEMWLRQNYNLRRNEVTLFIENEGKPLHKKDFNSIFIKAKKLFDKKINFELIDRLIDSDFTFTYNPFIEFFEANKEAYPVEKCTGTIKAFFDCIESKDKEYTAFFGGKWLTGIVSSVYGKHSVLFLALIGEVQNTGKTQVFRRLLPKELKKYYAESKLDAGKDDYILMTQRLVVVDDEMSGKSKKEAKLLKDITSKQVFTLREPYGRHNVDLLRIAMLGGTTNEKAVLYDTANRRVIPVEVNSIDYEAMNKIDRTALLMEAYWLYHENNEVAQLTREEIVRLNKDTVEFELTEVEHEALQKYFEPSEDGEKLSCSEIKFILQDLTRDKFILDRLGKALKKLNFKQVHVKLPGGSTKRAYLVKRIAQENGPGLPGLSNAGGWPAAPSFDPEDVPF